MTQLTDKIWAVEVPAYIVNEVCSIEQSLILMLRDDGYDELVVRGKSKTRPSVDYKRTIKIQPGSWQFLFTTKTATEAQAAGVVQVISNGKISGMPQYRRYDRDNELPARMWTRDAWHSLETLLRSKNLDPKNNYALIEKQSSDADRKTT